jgi:hypothetical protein
MSSFKKVSSWTNDDSSSEGEEDVPKSIKPIKSDETDLIKNQQDVIIFIFKLLPPICSFYIYFIRTKLLDYLTIKAKHRVLFQKKVNTLTKETIFRDQKENRKKYIIKITISKIINFPKKINLVIRDRKVIILITSQKPSPM